MLGNRYETGKASKFFGACGGLKIWKSNVLTAKINLAVCILGAISDDHAGQLEAPSISLRPHSTPITMLNTFH